MTDNTKDEENRGFEHFSSIEHKPGPTNELFYATEEQLNSVKIISSSPFYIDFCDQDSIVGHLGFNDKGMIKFSGKVEESAKVFFEYFCNDINHTIKEKNKYIFELENVLHKLHFNSQVSMNYDKVKDIMSAISSWSYAHRCGNGEPSEEEQQRMVDHAFEKLKEI